jgi:hypothetical protein
MDATMIMRPVGSIPVGTVVLDAAGDKVGRVHFADSVALLVHRGWLFPSEEEIPLREVDRYQDGKLILRRTMAEVLGHAA